MFFFLGGGEKKVKQEGCENRGGGYLFWGGGYLVWGSYLRYCYCEKNRF